MQETQFKNKALGMAGIRWTLFLLMLGLMWFFNAFGCEGTTLCPDGTFTVDGLCFAEGTGACCSTFGSDKFCSVRTRDECLAISNSFYHDRHTCESACPDSKKE